MIEILLIIFLAKKIGNVAEARGYGRILFQAMLVLFWFGGELFGAIFGAVLGSDRTGEAPFGAIYLFALLGAAAGAIAAFTIASFLPEQSRSRSYMDDYRDYDGAPRARRRRRPRYEEDEEERDERPRRRPHSEDEEDRPRRGVMPEGDYRDDRPRRRRDDEDDDPPPRRRPDDRYRK
jgi:hypothetical protein